MDEREAQRQAEKVARVGIGALSSAQEMAAKAEVLAAPDLEAETLTLAPRSQQWWSDPVQGGARLGRMLMVSLMLSGLGQMESLQAAEMSLGLLYDV